MKEINKFCLVNRTSPLCKPGSHKQPLYRVNAGLDPCRRHRDFNLHKFRLFGKVWTVGHLPLVANTDYKFNPRVYCSIDNPEDSSQGGRGSKMYAHLLSRGTNSIVDNIVV